MVCGRTGSSCGGEAGATRLQHLCGQLGSQDQLEVIFFDLIRTRLRVSLPQALHDEMASHRVEPTYQLELLGCWHAAPDADLDPAGLRVGISRPAHEDGFEFQRCRGHPSPPPPASGIERLAPAVEERNHEGVLLGWLDRERGA